MGGESSGGRLRELGDGVCSGEGVRERFKCCGAQPDQLGLDRSDRSPIPVRPVRATGLPGRTRVGGFGPHSI